MRIATSTFHERALAALMARQDELSRTQNQLATGQRVQRPADDPGAAVHIQELERALSESGQYARNATAAKSRLSLEEQALSDADTLLQRVRELAVQANSDTLDAGARRVIGAELESRLAELTDLANRRDAVGEYLFAGYSTASPPFARGASGGVQYLGDAGVRYQQLGPTQRVADGHPGYDVFVDVAQGNGRFVTTANAANSGTGVIDAGAVTDPGSWTAGDYTLRFTSPGSWEIVDAGATVVASGAYTAGGAIEWPGARVVVTGQPASGDTFSLAASRREDLFTTIDRLIAAVRAPATTPAARAQVTNAVGVALTQLDRGSDHLHEIRAAVGARLASVDQADAARDDFELELKSTLSDLRDLDYAGAIARMNQQYAGLQAAQASYSRLAQLSLFDYLR